MSTERAWIDGGWGAVSEVTPADAAMAGEEAAGLPDGMRPERVTLLSGLLSGAVAGCPPLAVMGARMWVMLEGLCPGLLRAVKLTRVERGLVRGVSGLGGVCGAEAGLEDRWRVGELLRGREVRLAGLGRRVSLLAYMLERGEVVRSALPSMEALGVLWGLRARNKRSAICAAMMAIQAELDKGELRWRDHETTVLWYQKRRVARGVYERAQMGNCNRKGKRGAGAAAAGAAVVVGELEAEAEEEAGRVLRVELVEEVFEMVGRVRVRSGPLPIKPEFQGLSGVQLRARLEALHDAAERRRLGV